MLTTADISTMSRSQLAAALRASGLDVRGTREEQAERLLAHAAGRQSPPYQRPPQVIEPSDEEIDARRAAVMQSVASRPGWSIEHQSESGSIYALHTATLTRVRLSDHYVPASPEREHNGQPWDYDLIHRHWRLEQEWSRVASLVESEAEVV